MKTINEKTTKSFAWFVDQYRGAGWFPYIFGTALFGALFAAVLSIVIAIRTPDPLLPWGTYSTPVYIGTINATEPNVVIRQTGMNGVPVVTDPIVQVVAVRCGPVHKLEVVSTRFWTITTEPGPAGQLIDRAEGNRIPITLEPSTDDSGCQIIQTTVNIPPEIAAIGEGNVMMFRADVAPVNRLFQPVPATSEQFYYKPGFPVDEVFDSRVTIEVP